ncbi:MAG: hypothetical protein ABTQ31_19220 [Rhizobiaceae bacterium]
MRALLMALFSFDFPGHAAGRGRASHGISKAPAKSTFKTTTKTV